MCYTEVSTKFKVSTVILLYFSVFSKYSYIIGSVQFLQVIFQRFPNILKFLPCVCFYKSDFWLEIKFCVFSTLIGESNNKKEVSKKISVITATSSRLWRLGETLKQQSNRFPTRRTSIHMVFRGFDPRYLPESSDAVKVLVRWNRSELRLRKQGATDSQERFDKFHFIILN